MSRKTFSAEEVANMLQDDDFDFSTIDVDVFKEMMDGFNEDINSRNVNNDILTNITNDEIDDVFLRGAVDEMIPLLDFNNNEQVLVETYPGTNDLDLNNDEQVLVETYPDTNDLSLYSENESDGIENVNKINPQPEIGISQKRKRKADPNTWKQNINKKKSFRGGIYGV